jgi:cytochrome P450
MLFLPQETNTMSENLTIATPEGISSRFSVYEKMRSKPIYRDPVSGFFVVTNMDDVRAIGMDAVRFSNKTQMLVGRSSGSSAKIAKMFQENGYPQVDTISSNDPPSHRSYRRIIDHAFRPQRVRQMGDYMDKVIDDLIDKFPEDGRVDFVESYAIYLPMIVIADQMGIGRDQISDFKRWSDAVMATSNQLTSPEDMVEAAKAIIELQQFLANEFDEARANPREDIISDIATGEIDGRLLETKEMVSIGLTLLVAGNETTTNGLGSAILRMIDEGVGEDIRKNPGLAITFTEEVLRLDCPIQLLYRRAKEDVEYKGTVIHKGSIIQLVWAAANRDETQFKCPAEFHTDRGGPGRHVTFGAGIHFCVGNILARAEINSTLRTITQRLRNIRVADEPNAIIRPVHTLAYGPTRLVLNYEKL